MGAEFPILQFSNELEDAGTLGLFAGSMLGILLLGGDNPGAISSNDEGFTWSKLLGDELTDQVFDLGIAKLKVQSVRFGATLAVKLTNGVPSHIDLMISFLGEATGAIA